VLLVDDDPYPPSVVDDALVTHVVVDDAARAVKNDALRAHATQVLVVSEDVHALSNLVATRTTGREGFRRVDPRTWQPVRVAGREASLLG
jgi:N-acetyl-1-D-myo-inositol-2-amino-2-deoxy-alpha-D-glucopyranoside deacetylase